VPYTGEKHKLKVASRPVLNSTQPTTHWELKTVTQCQSGRGVKLNTTIHQMPILRVNTAILPLFPMALRFTDGIFDVNFA
jgi:hypothetical protein